MGFRCPVCHKDFGKEKAEWQKHCDEAHAGVGAQVVKAITDVCESKDEEQGEN